MLDLGLHFLKVISYFLNQAPGPQTGQLGEKPPESLSARTLVSTRGFPMPWVNHSDRAAEPELTDPSFSTHLCKNTAIIIAIITITYCRVEHISYNYIKTLLTILLKYLGFFPYLPVFPQLK